MKEYKTNADLYKRLGISRQRAHQIFDLYGLTHPEPDAVLGKRRLYLPETLEKYAETFPTKKNLFLELEKWKSDNPDFISARDFVRSKGIPVSEREAFLSKIAKLTTDDEITHKKYGKFRLYKAGDLSEIYDKTYAEIRTFSISKLTEEAAKNPGAITLEQFAELTGLSFNRVMYRKTCANPRPRPVLRVSGKHFYNHEDLIKTLNDKDHKQIKGIAESKMSVAPETI